MFVVAMYQTIDLKGQHALLHENGLMFTWVMPTDSEA
jgi:hypothetical protein